MSTIFGVVSKGASGIPCSAIDELSKTSQFDMIERYSWMELMLGDFSCLIKEQKGSWVARDVQDPSEIQSFFACFQEYHVNCFRYSANFVCGLAGQSIDARQLLLQLQGRLKYTRNIESSLLVLLSLSVWPSGWLWSRIDREFYFWAGKGRLYHRFDGHLWSFSSMPLQSFSELDQTALYTFNFNTFRVVKILRKESTHA